VAYEKPFLFTTATTGTAFTTIANATYSFDCGSTGKYLGNQARPIVFKGRVVTGFTGAASGVKIGVVTSDTDTISTGDLKVLAWFVSALGVYTGTNLTDCAIPTTDIATAGNCIWAVIPPNIKALRYLTIRVIPMSEALATGYFEFSMEVGAGEAGVGNVA
jgi:hypothetical protein